MGWKASFIIVQKPVAIDHLTLLKHLGFSGLSKTDNEPFEVAIYPEDNKVYIGSYKDNLLICAPDIPLQLFEDEPSWLEKKLKSLFPQSELCAIVLQSTVNLWGYSVIVNGQKRARAGSADDGTFLSIGDPLEEEKELLSKSTIDEEGNRIYLLEDFPDEPFQEDQVGENFVFSICKRYFGAELHSADNEHLFETMLEGYTYEHQLSENTHHQNTNKSSNKPWWKFW